MVAQKFGVAGAFLIGELLYSLPHPGCCPPDGLQSSSWQGKASLFAEHNSYTRQYEVLYSYIKSQEGK